MKRLQFKKLDAFTLGQSEGNPAGCIYLSGDDELTKMEMQQVARELKGFVNEVAFLSSDNGIRLQYFSSECEVDFCGHATVAVLYDLISQDPNLLTQNSVTISVGSEKLEVINRIQKEKSVFITAPSPRYNEQVFDGEALSQALNMPSNHFRQNLPIQSIHAGLSTLIVPINNLDTILKIQPDQEILKDYCLSSNVDIIIVFSPEVSKRESLFRSRVFAPKFGYLEDPATGSGNSALGYYLLKHRLWDGRLIIIEQNASYENPNKVLLRAINKPEGKRVAFGGSAITRIEGEYLLYHKNTY